MHALHAQSQAKRAPYARVLNERVREQRVRDGRDPRLTYRSSLTPRRAGSDGALTHRCSSVPDAQVQRRGEPMGSGNSTERRGR